jgi:hypothetical protein
MKMNTTRVPRCANLRWLGAFVRAAQLALPDSLRASPSTPDLNSNLGGSEVKRVDNDECKKTYADNAIAPRFSRPCKIHATRYKNTLGKKVQKVLDAQAL